MFNKKVLFCFAVISVLLVVGWSGLAHALPYAPGETLNPGCLPTDADCTVSGSWLFGGNTLAATGTLGTLSAHSLNLITSSTTRLTILEDGGILIGTSTMASGAPAGSLAIAGKYYGDGSALTGVSALPSMTDQSGKYLFTNGTVASWAAVSSTKTYVFQGVTQMGVNAWALNYQTLANASFGTTDATHLRSSIIIAAGSTWTANAGTNSLGPWTVTPVTATNPTVTFTVETRAGGSTSNNGSMALSYACVPAGQSVDSPTPVALTAITLTAPTATKSVYQSSQQVTCSGTPESPADLYIWWTPTAPSDQSLSLLRLSLSY
jgi:hypothetical protein